MTYGFLPGFVIKGNKQEGLKQIAALADEDRLTPDALVEANRAEDAPLHECFEWDDHKAAVEYRLDQARYIIRAVSITVEEMPETPIRAFVPTRNAGEKITEYKPIITVMKSNEEYILRQAFDDLMRFHEKYEHLKQLAKVIHAAEETIDELKDELEAR